MPERDLYRENPKMFRNAPFAFILSVLLIPVAGLGIIILLVWYLRCKTDELAITEVKVVWRHGLLSKSIIELNMPSIRSIRINQSVGQRIFGTGDVAIYTAGDDPELLVKGLPRPEFIRDSINDLQQRDA